MTSLEDKIRHAMKQVDSRPQTMPTTASTPPAATMATAKPTPRTQPVDGATAIASSPPHEETPSPLMLHPLSPPSSRVHCQQEPTKSPVAHSTSPSLSPSSASASTTTRSPTHAAATNNGTNAAKSSNNSSSNSSSSIDGVSRKPLLPVESAVQNPGTKTYSSVTPASSCKQQQKQKQPIAKTKRPPSTPLASNGRAKAANSEALMNDKSTSSKKAATLPAATSPSAATMRLYSDASERTKRLKVKQRENPVGCTFSPDITSAKQHAAARASTDATRNATAKPAIACPSTSVASAVVASSTVNPARFDRLYEDSKARNDRLQQRRSLAEESPDGCTFSPAVNHKPRKIIGNNATRSAENSRLHAQRMYEENKVRIAKQEETRKLLLEAEKPSFKPKITRKGRRAPSPGPAGRMQHLYQSNLGVDKTREEKRKELQLDGCTFRPKINRSRSLSRQRGFKPDNGDGGAGAGAGAGGSIHPPENNGSTVMVAEATVGSSTAHARGRPNATSVHDRLQAFGEEKERKIEERRKQQLENERKQLTFKPKLNSGSRGRSRGRSSSNTRGRHGSSTAGGPEAAAEISDGINNANGGDSPAREAIHSRLYNEASNREILSKQLRKQMDEEAGLTFQPDVSKTSSSSASRRRRSSSARRSPRLDAATDDSAASPSGGQQQQVSSVFLRLSTPKENEKQQHKQREEEKLLRDLAECTFAPRITKTTPMTKAKAAVADGTDCSSPVWERLYKEKDVSAEVRQKQKLKVQHELMEQCTFAPNVTDIASTTAKALRGSGGNDASTQSQSGSTVASAIVTAETFTRLSQVKPNKERVRELEQRKREEELATCTFTPQISQASADIMMTKVKPSSPLVWDRLLQQRNDEEDKASIKSKLVAKEREEKKLEECTFQPKVNPNSALLLTSPKVTSGRKQVVDSAAAKPSAAESTPRKTNSSSSSHRRTSERRSISSAKTATSSSNIAVATGTDISGVVVETGHQLRTPKNNKNTFLERLALTAEKATATAAATPAPKTPTAKAAAVTLGAPEQQLVPGELASSAAVAEPVSATTDTDVNNNNNNDSVLDAAEPVNM